MACYHPLKAFPIGLTDAGKTKYKIVPFAVHHIEVQQNGTFIPVSTDFLSPYARKNIVDFIQIPCGQCIGCRLEYSRQWANRCMLELEYHDSAYFVTLTYDDDHVPVSYYGDPDTGLATPSLTLRKRDFQLFMKRLRKAFPDDHIRFFAAGEYGSQTFRPHYHAIIFGLHLDDLTLYKKSPDNKFSYFNSASLQRCWSVIESRKNSTTLLTQEELVIKRRRSGEKSPRFYPKSFPGRHLVDTQKQKERQGHETPGPRRPFLVDFW